MKIKFYELVIPQEIKIPFININENKVKCHHCPTSVNDVLNQMGIEKEFYCAGFFLDFIQENSYVAFNNVLDNPKQISFFLKREVNKAIKEKIINTDSDITVIHRKHPFLSDVRQFSIVSGKTDYPIHWID